MPLPVLIAIVGILLGGTVVALNWDGIVIALAGKRLAVLGARGVGKTHLIKFLSTGSIPADYRQTVAPEKTPRRRFRLADLHLNIKDTLDVSGDKAAYAEWKRLHDDADLILYLLRADRLISGDPEVEARVREDARHLGEWFQARSSPVRLFVIGTHCDLDPEFARLTPSTAGEYADRFRRLPIVVELIARLGGADKAKVVLGAMNTLDGTETLVFQVFSQVLA